MVIDAAILSLNRLQQTAAEVGKRETVYADFVTSASNTLLRAFVSDEMSVGSDEQRLIGLINRTRLFAPLNVGLLSTPELSITTLPHTQANCEAFQCLGEAKAPVYGGFWRS